MRKAHLDEAFIVDLTVAHLVDYGGFDTVIKYDNSKIQLLDIKAVSGIKFFVKRLGPDEVRVTIFGITDKNFVQIKQTLLKFAGIVF